MHTILEAAEQERTLAPGSYAERPEALAAQPAWFRGTPSGAPGA